MQRRENPKTHKMHNEINHKAVPNRSALNQPVKKSFKCFHLTYICILTPGAVCRNMSSVAVGNTVHNTMHNCLHIHKGMTHKPILSTCYKLTPCKDNIYMTDLTSFIDKKMTSVEHVQLVKKFPTSDRT
jgi:hypothetical protein